MYNLKEKKEVKEPLKQLTHEWKLPECNNKNIRCFTSGLTEEHDWPLMVRLKNWQSKTGMRFTDLLLSVAAQK